MRKLLLPVALLPFAVLAVDLQGEKTAEQVYKNIKSFKGMPAKDLLPAMKFMSASMKVDCNFCHDGDDFASEKKREKEITRDMIELQRDINAKFFNGRLEVTCMSCHNGLTHPVGSPAPEGLSTKHKRTDPTVKPADLVARHEAAVGPALKSLVLTGKLNIAGNDIPTEFARSGEDNYVLELGTDRFGANSSQGAWVFAHGNGQKLVTEEFTPFHSAGRSFRSAAILERYERLSLVGEEDLQGRRALIVRGPIKGSQVTEEMYFDAETGLLVRLATHVRTSLGVFPSYVDFENYRAVEGTKVPFKWTFSSSDGKPWVFEAANAKANVPIEAKRFELPVQGVPPAK